MTGRKVIAVCIDTYHSQVIKSLLSLRFDYFGLVPYLYHAFLHFPGMFIMFACLLACLTLLPHSVRIGNAASKARACFFYVLFCTQCALQNDEMQ